VAYSHSSALGADALSLQCILAWPCCRRAKEAEEQKLKGQMAAQRKVVVAKQTALEAFNNSSEDLVGVMCQILFLCVTLPQCLHLVCRELHHIVCQAAHIKR